MNPPLPVDYSWRNFARRVLKGHFKQNKGQTGGENVQKLCWASDSAVLNELIEMAERTGGAGSICLVPSA